MNLAPAILSLATGLLALLSSCIDEDLSQCGQTCRIDYAVHLHTPLQTQLDSQLSPEAASHVRNQLLATLAPIFSDKISDIELSFYTSQGSAHYEEHTLNASQASFQIYLDADDYRHHAVANRKAAAIDKRNAHSATTHSMHSPQGDTIECHGAALYIGTLPLSIDKRSNAFAVNLHMANCATTLIIDLSQQSPRTIRCLATGFASHFMVNDSAYAYDRGYHVRALPIADTGQYACFYTVNFPSRDSARADSSDPRPLWEIKAYVGLADGTLTESTLSVTDPLLPGQLRAIECALRPDGSLAPTTPNVGVSVQLDWKPGGNYDIPI